MDDEGAPVIEESLLSLRRKGGNRSGTAKRGGFKVTKHGLFSATLLLLLGGVSLFYDYKITTLQSLLDDEKKSLEQLESVVADHSAVITRFNCKSFFCF
jgi:hypothetical protein